VVEQRAAKGTVPGRRRLPRPGSGDSDSYLRSRGIAHINSQCSLSMTARSLASVPAPRGSRTGNAGDGCASSPSTSTRRHGALPSPARARSDSAPPAVAAGRADHFSDAHYTRVGGRCAAVDHVGRRVSREQFDASLRGDARGRDGGIREELARG
jgi:hypothetical protein